jgi:hypothetical protein
LIHAELKACSSRIELLEKIESSVVYYLKKSAIEIDSAAQLAPLDFIVLENFTMSIKQGDIDEIKKEVDSPSASTAQNSAIAENLGQSMQAVFDGRTAALPVNTPEPQTEEQLYQDYSHK